MITRGVLTVALLGLVVHAAAMEADTLLRLAFDDGLPAGATDGAQLIAGWRGQALLAGRDRPCALVVPATGRLNLARGTIHFWLRPMEPLRQAPPRPETNLVVLDAGAAAAGNPNKTANKVWNVFLAQTSAVRLRGETFDDAGEYHGTQIEYLRLHERWYHFAFTWDCERGRLAQYLNARLDQEIVSTPWRPQPLEGNLLIGNPWLALDELVILDRPLGADEIAAAAGLRPGQGLTDEGLEPPAPSIDLSAARGELVLAEDFDDAAALADWVLEGTGEAAIEHGRLCLRANQERHVVLWNRAELPADLVIEYDFSPVHRHGLCILFFCASGSGGRDLFDPSLAPRDGLFPQYNNGDIVAYHVSYFRNLGADTTLCNLRKDPGMALLGTGRDPIPPRTGGTYRLVLVKRGATFAFFIDGQHVLNGHAEPELLGPLWGAGKLGLRQMAPMEACYDNLRVYRAR